jgi:hypothetical protein
MSPTQPPTDAPTTSDPTRAPTEAPTEAPTFFPTPDTGDASTLTVNADVSVVQIASELTANPEGLTCLDLETKPNTDAINYHTFDLTVDSGVSAGSIVLVTTNMCPDELDGDGNGPDGGQREPNLRDRRQTAEIWWTTEVVIADTSAQTASSLTTLSADAESGTLDFSGVGLTDSTGTVSAGAVVGSFAAANGVFTVPDIAAFSDGASFPTDLLTNGAQGKANPFCPNACFTTHGKGKKTKTRLVKQAKKGKATGSTIDCSQCVAPGKKGKADKAKKGKAAKAKKGKKSATASSLSARLTTLPANTAATAVIFGVVLAVGAALVVVRRSGTPGDSAQPTEQAPMMLSSIHTDAGETDRLLAPATRTDGEPRAIIA